MFCEVARGSSQSGRKGFWGLFKQWYILYRLTQLWRKSNMNNIVLAWVTVHNVCVEERRDQYNGTEKARLPEDETRLPTEVHLNWRPTDRADAATRFRELLDGCEDVEQHLKLMKALANHIWKARGDICHESDGDDFTCEEYYFSGDDSTAGGIESSGDGEIFSLSASIPFQS